MKMKRTLAILLALVMCWSLTACGAPEEPAVTDGETEPSTTGAVFDGTLAVGDTMPDMTVTTTDGKTVMLSQLLKEKKLVVLNFWYANCGWCRKEFPAMEVAYQRCKADVEILALNPVDSAVEVMLYAKENELSFPMAGCSRSLALSFGINGYPTSVFIDRYGTVCLIHEGAITDVQTFVNIFEIFTGDNYMKMLFPDGIGQLTGRG